MGVAFCRVDLVVFFRKEVDPATTVATFVSGRWFRRIMSPCFLQHSVGSQGFTETGKPILDGGVTIHAQREVIEDLLDDSSFDPVYSAQ